MLLKPQLQEIADTYTNGNIGHTEKLYLQDIILHSIYQKTTDELIFKGGTALLKLYNLDRFSEDLDFTLNKETDLNKVIKDSKRHLENFGIEIEEEQTEETEETYKTRLGIKGPLYSGTRLSLSFIRIEINKKAEAQKPVNKRYSPIFPDIPTFNIITLNQEEILAEKIRALMTRTRARDLYDIYHLLNKDVGIDKDLTNKKLSYYDKEFNREEVIQRAKNIEKGWEDLSTLTFSEPVSFDKVLRTLKENLKQ